MFTRYHFNAAKMKKKQINMLYVDKLQVHNLLYAYNSSSLGVHPL